MRKYENPVKTSENRLKQRSWYIPEDSAFCSLNGKWRFRYFENGDKVAEITEWDNISVPSCWQLKGYEKLFGRISYGDFAFFRAIKLYLFIAA